MVRASTIRLFGVIVLAAAAAIVVRTAIPRAFESPGAAHVSHHRHRYDPQPLEVSPSFQRPPREPALECPVCPALPQRSEPHHEVVKPVESSEPPNLSNILERLGDRHCVPDMPGQMPEADRKFKANLPFEALCSGHLNMQQTTSMFRIKLEAPSVKENKPPKRRFDDSKCCGTRYELLDALKTQGFRGWAIELGVATGDFSNSILDQTDFDKLISVDFWEKDRRRIPALKQLRQGAHVLRSCAIWDTFEHALELFKNTKFNFVFVDGYAKEGEGGSKTLLDWYKRVNVGGVFAGHDYDDHFPAVKETVHGFLKHHPELKLHTMNGTGSTWDEWGSWYVIKEK